MKPFDLFYLSLRNGPSIFVGLLVCYSLTAMAEPPRVETFNPAGELILNLSDKWLEPQADLDSGFKKSSQTSSSSDLVAGKTASRKANIGCNMDVSSLPVTDDSLTSRLEGKCNFDYHY